MIYADNAATTKLDMDAFEAMKPFLLEEYGNASQLYSFARTGKRALMKSREMIAECIGANTEEIFFTSGGTESDNWAIKMGAGREGTVITSAIEHHAILNSCHMLERDGRKVIYLPVDNKGIVHPESLKDSLQDNTGLVSIIFANNEVGSVQPIKELVDIAHKSGVLFHTDAVQIVGHLPIDVHSLEVDMLSASAHKFNAPKGIGFLYIRNGTKIFPYMNGGNQEFGHRAGTENIASIVAMAVALKKNCERMMTAKLHLINLEEIIISELNNAGLNFIRNGSENRIPGNISISFKGVEGEMILHRMDLKGICISTGAACDSINTKISHVIQAMNIHREYASGTIRISLGYENTEKEVVQIAKALISILNR